METALIKEINKDYIEAVKEYEKDIKIKENPSPESYINLSFLYWSFAFDNFGFNLPNKIPDEYSMIGGNRYQIILESGLIKYPNNIELIFWKKYFEHIIYGEMFTENDCLALFENYKENDSLVPYFFLFEFNNEKYLNKRNLLLENCKSYPTAKNIYIKSIIGKIIS